MPNFFHVANFGHIANFGRVQVQGANCEFGDTLFFLLLLHLYFFIITLLKFSIIGLRIKSILRLIIEDRERRHNVTAQHEVTGYIACCFTYNRRRKKDMEEIIWNFDNVQKAYATRGYEARKKDMERPAISTWSLSNQEKDETN
jgi:hypothetical protein